MAETKKTAKKKMTRKEKIAFHKAEAKRLEAEEAEYLEKDAPGMVDLLAAFKQVCDRNDVRSIVVIKTLSKVRHLGLKFTTPERKSRTSKAKTKQGAVKQGATKQGSTKSGHLVAVAS